MFQCCSLETSHPRLSFLNFKNSFLSLFKIQPTSNHVTNFLLKSFQEVPAHMMSWAQNPKNCILKLFVSCTNLFLQNYLPFISFIFILILPAPVPLKPTWSHSNSTLNFSSPFSQMQFHDCISQHLKVIWSVLVFDSTNLYYYCLTLNVY